MHSQTAGALRDINRAFYEKFAGSFDASRAPTEPGLKRIFPRISPGSRVLDLGCGHGRLAALLPPNCTYLGVDNAEAMLALAQGHVDQEAKAIQAQFIALDLLDSDWAIHVPGSFDWIVVRAVLHHIPGYANRRNLLEQSATLLNAEGRLLIANWQFLEIPRLRRRVLPWSEVGLKPTAVEPGDYLLDWRRDGYGRRYVHLVNESETQTLAHDSGLTVVEMFRADGHTNDLTLYAILSGASGNSV
jgi:tRNA (uracil-5-)-methyltransferase TRM9